MKQRRKKFEQFLKTKYAGETMTYISRVLDISSSYLYMLIAGTCTPTMRLKRSMAENMRISVKKLEELLK